MGFSESVELPELVELGRKNKLPVIHDIGSGALVDFGQLGFRGEPMARESIRAGADIVLFSGDKLLGGPQCGIIAGRKALVEKIERHPLARALRLDKITLSALGATLRLYRDPQQARQSVPILRLLSASVDNLKCRAERLAPQMAAVKTIVNSAEAISDVTYIGGGSIPTQQLPTWCVALKPESWPVDRLAAALRTGVPAVIGRVRDDRLLLDLRSVFPRQDAEMLTALEALGKG
jgi:L-seryl-tRNA(Ser) seleniumtransferase